MTSTGIEHVFNIDVFMGILMITVVRPSNLAQTK